ncbi:ABC transporter permease [Neokomagataea thailandica]|uniref:Dipeptide/oligopeptide/nickel ABC transporter permease n=1 Tax=Neokomagataea tanensis NBRC 106556 TaxID=1223519 RepID=A0ABQ0QIT3_9PROT|nr:MULTISPECIES: ABC transporter permease [Neokomagataea]GBR46305.1 dipeptide/oligopeptide/nickel ABC transporter permease [Neokomagataea tanensis NBRC 106556]
MKNSLPKLIGKRCLAAATSLVFVVVTVFAVTNILPGDATDALLGQNATPQTVAALRHGMGLDQPIFFRFWSWLWAAVHGEFGHSLLNGLSVADAIGPRLHNSLLLAGAAALIAVPASLFLGITSAIWKDTFYDRIVSIMTLGVVSVPEFVIATIAVYVFSVRLHLLPAIVDVGSVHSLGQFLYAFFMPVTTLALVSLAQMVRMTRAAMADTLSASYIEMALLKGIGPVRLILVHALPNALGPIVNAVALSLSSLLGGVVVIEVVFTYPGIAGLMVDAVSSRDVPMVQACALVFCVTYLILTTFADIVTILSLPRGRKA